MWYLSTGKERGADCYQETSNVLVTSRRGCYDPENQKSPALSHGCQVLPGAPSWTPGIHKAWGLVSKRMGSSTRELEKPILRMDLVGLGKKSRATESMEGILQEK